MTSPAAADAFAAVAAAANVCADVSLQTWR
jgi:hypothetical protein